MAYPDRLQLSNAALGVRIEPQDPAGEYLVRARVRDVNGDKAVKLESVFTVAGTTQESGAADKTRIPK